MPRHVRSGKWTWPPGNELCGRRFGTGLQSIESSYQKGDQTWSKYVCCKKISVVHFCVCVYVIYAAEMFPMEWRIIGTGEIGLRVAEISKVLHWVVESAGSWLQRLVLMSFHWFRIVFCVSIEFLCWRWDLGWFPAYYCFGFTVWFPSSWLLRGIKVYSWNINKYHNHVTCVYIHGWRFSRCDYHPLCIDVMHLSNPLNGLAFQPHFTCLKQEQTFGD